MCRSYRPPKIFRKEKKHNNEHTVKAVISELAAQKFHITQSDDNHKLSINFHMPQVLS